MALCSWSSLIVGESGQYFLPCSRRLIHRHTICFFPLADHVVLRYWVPQWPQMRSSESAYLLEYLPCSVIVLSLILRLELRLASSCWTRLYVSLSIIGAWWSVTRYMGRSPWFFTILCVMQSTVKVFWRSASPTYFSFFRILLISDSFQTFLPFAVKIPLLSSVFFIFVMLYPSRNNL